MAAHPIRCQDDDLIIATVLGETAQNSGVKTLLFGARDSSADVPVSVSDSGRRLRLSAKSADLFCSSAILRPIHLKLINIVII